MDELRPGDLPPGGGPRWSSGRPTEVRKQAVEEHLETLPSRATWIGSNGSAEAGVTQRGGGVCIQTHLGELV